MQLEVQRGNLIGIASELRSYDGPELLDSGHVNRVAAFGFRILSEGLWGVREWNYIFQFRTGSGPEYITCQYMVRFNDDVVTNGLYWNKPECAALVNLAKN
ncbi:hypothetical protein [Variovorax sp. DT-64]|uniref:hypothetical protein n=1 Tax=Variovorax sp. DT-64 TaxID=3396160 RepID=UPI003F199407